MTKTRHYDATQLISVAAIIRSMLLGAEAPDSGFKFKQKELH